MTLDPFKKRANKVFHTQKRHAAKRGLGFEFTYQEWLTWWETALGPDWMEKRGCKRGQYVMARLGDKGPYSADNVKCVLCSENQREQIANGSSGAGWNRGMRGRPKKGNKIDAATAVAIFKATGPQRSIGAAYGVSQGQVHRIKAGKDWNWATRDLTCAS